MPGFSSAGAVSSSSVLWCPSWPLTRLACPVPPQLPLLHTPPVHSYAHPRDPPQLRRPPPSPANPKSFHLSLAALPIVNIPRPHSLFSYSRPQVHAVLLPRTARFPIPLVACTLEFFQTCCISTTRGRSSASDSSRSVAKPKTAGPGRNAHLELQIPDSNPRFLTQHRICEISSPGKPRLHYTA